MAEKHANLAGRTRRDARLKYFRSAWVGTLTLALPLVAYAQGGARNVELAAAARAVVTRLGSPHCSDRQQAVREGLEGPGAEPLAALILALEQELASAPPLVRAKGEVLLAYHRQWQTFEASGGIPAWLEKRAGRGNNESAAERRARYESFLRTAVTEARDTSRDFFLRTMAINMIGFFLSRHPQREDAAMAERLGIPVREGRSILFMLVSDPDPDVNVVAAAIASKLHGLSDSEKRLIVSKLIDGLRHPDFAARLFAYEGLKLLTGKDFCVDSTDAIADREPAIQQWEGWWAGQRGAG